MQKGRTLRLRSPRVRNMWRPKRWRGGSRLAQRMAGRRSASPCQRAAVRHHPLPHGACEPFDAQSPRAASALRSAVYSFIMFRRSLARSNGSFCNPSSLVALSLCVEQSLPAGPPAFVIDSAHARHYHDANDENRDDSCRSSHAAGAQPGRVHFKMISRTSSVPRTFLYSPRSNLFLF
jgi:hypothetical protein